MEDPLDRKYLAAIPVAVRRATQAAILNMD